MHAAPHPALRTRLARLALLPAALALAGAICALPAQAEPVQPAFQLAQQEKPALIDTLKDLVSIESGSKDIEGLDRIANLIRDRLAALGGDAKLIEPTDVYRMEDTPPKVGKMVMAQFKGTGQRKIMLIAHMDTVYLRGMLAQQPFRVDGDRAYGLGIADDKNGVAVILHTVAILQKMKFKDYGTLTVLINGDEEISSPGARATLTKLGAEQDAVFSCEASRVTGDRLSLATSGIGAISLKVDGKSSHAGSSPELGRNALYELSHQILQMRDLSNPDTGLKVNWTLSHAGTNRNVIPAVATAQADVRVLRTADYDGLERTLQERIQKKLIPDTKVEVKFERRRPPLEATPASRALAAHAQGIYAEIGEKLAVYDTAEGGGTDAAFAAAATKAPVIERFGLRGFGAHSNDAEYVDLNSVTPRLYLLTRMIMDVSQDKTGK
ncbi:M20/M25/M40 family metallo-hydrolase [Cupriavidus metallidurans]|uniref:M20/M25/M40 family metallo-hydrolase n=1 Tax=Cupriavidus TaxID=106589 RepID=UPI0002A26B66|nr:MULTISPECIES: M20/M25/M40 family metallo-hydrolase [unclassified Cupriavidus]EKZ99186.1 glutamate carboxypeptidase [Cupriavidus sp. HMR-1]GMG91880.1 glutamate carboxypeptidase [Cupriavidus sp. TKC]HBO77709.1 glutamate carboxypeptidase [Cupriavidus sp.]